jgi:Xaa-Pro dipeptidase
MMNGSSSSPGFLSMGGETYKVSLKDVFGANRAKLVKKLQSVDLPKGSIVYLQGGTSQNRYDTDHEPLFRQESYFLYLTGVKDPDCQLLLDVDAGRTTLLIPKLPQDYATIMGHIRTPQEWKELYQVDEVAFVEDATSLLEQSLVVMPQNVTNGSRPKLLLLEGRNSDSGNFYKAPSVSSEKLQNMVDTHLLFPILAECRVIKSAAELSLLQHVTELTSFAHAYVMRNTKPGMYEYQSESLFRHYCYYNYGCRLVGYTPICGCGPNAAILHYGHAGEPNAKLLKKEDICLYDMGAEYVGGYSSDVTCSFPASGKFTNKQAGVFTGVLNAQRAVYAILKPGVSWVDCHKAAEAAILQQLTDIGIVVPGETSIDELVEMRLGAVFMPHGLGHFIGIDTHDVGGYLPGHEERSSLAGLKSLRTCRVMETSMVITVEPGCYFIKHLLDGALEGPLREYLNADLVEEYRGFGGVRLEDVVAITETGCINFTLCPRTISEIEHVMAGGKWPPVQDEAPELLRVRLRDPTPLPSPPSS